MYHEHVNSSISQKSNSVSANSITIAGFLLFLTGVMLFTAGMIEIVVNINSIKTAAMLLIGLGCYKLGHSLIRYCATRRKRPERRRQPLVKRT